MDDPIADGDDIETGGEPRSTSWRDGPWWAWWIAVAVIHAVVFGPIAYRGIFRDDEFVGPNLFDVHVSILGYAFADYWRPFTPGYLFRFLGEGANDVFRFGDPRIGGLVACVIGYSAFGVALYVFFRCTTRGTPLLSPFAALGASLGVALLQSPGALWGWQRFQTDRLFLPLYLPFVPTTLLVLGLNVVLLIAVCALLDGQTTARDRWLIAVLVVVNAFAKPTLLPVLAAAAVIVALLPPRDRTAGVRRRRLGEVLWFVVAPAAVIMFLQLLVTVYKVEYPGVGIDDRGGWALHPLAELRAMRGLTPLFFTAFLFPVLALAVWGRKLLEDLAVELCVIATGIGLAAALLLERTGTLQYRGDMLQPMEAGLAALILALIRRLIELRKTGELTPGSIVVAALLLAPYVVAGLTSYGCHLGAGCPSL